MFDTLEKIIDKKKKKKLLQKIELSKDENFYIGSKSYEEKISKINLTKGLLDLYQSFYLSFKEAYKSDIINYSEFILGISFDFDEKEGVVKVEITTSRPGLLIGKHGYKIDNLEKIMSKMISNKVSIKIKERNNLFGIF